MHKRSLKDNLRRSKRSQKTTRVYGDEVIKLNTLKTRRLKNLLGASSLIIFQRRRKRELVKTVIQVVSFSFQASLVTLFHPYSFILSCDQSDKDDEGNEEQEAMNVDEKESEEELEEESYRREMRQKKRQERVEEGQSSKNMTQIMDMITSLQAFINSRFDALDRKIVDIQERVTRMEAKDKGEDE
ncbi:hypothetical protein M9H77_02370 [Catharanthus roseus]|uniref:Uncharacterized protein n=1 Tax=Catharanthus roseus TaxID=4058 RepID=A0ACC0C848_CATRO|nr:hypothetical protein M9H77_02370 [Catharanthus roseus]